MQRFNGPNFKKEKLLILIENQMQLKFWLGIIAKRSEILTVF